jgi:hypothetical protein
MVDANTIWKDYPAFYGRAGTASSLANIDGNGTPGSASPGVSFTAPFRESACVVVDRHNRGWSVRNGDAKIGTLALTGRLPYALEARIIAAPREDGKDRVEPVERGLGPGALGGGAIPLRRIRTIPIVGYSLIDVDAVRNVGDDGRSRSWASL